MKEKKGEKQSDICRPRGRTEDLGHIRTWIVNKKKDTSKS